MRKWRNNNEDGHPIQVVEVGSDHSFKLNEEALLKILNQDDIKDRQVVVVSVVGAFRKGKSFLLNYFLRYMNAKYVEGKTDDSWLGNDNEPLTGFSWRAGSKRETTGILIWSKVFPLTLKNGKEVAVILMDTQGIFDTESTVKEGAIIFALSTMLSSIQVYNLTSNIQEDDLHHLHMFTEYGKLAIENDLNSKPFQRLQFLVRDWESPFEYAYGAEGGREFLEKRLRISNRHAEHKNVRVHIKSCFDDTSCFLMPHPGQKVPTNPNYDGRISEIDEEFKQKLKELIPNLLSPENLVTKKINGQGVKAKDLIEYFKKYIAIFQSNVVPEPKTMLHATAEANHIVAMAEAREIYEKGMKSHIDVKIISISKDDIYSLHERYHQQAMHHFRNKAKMGGEYMTETYLKKLEQEIDGLYVELKKLNDFKSVREGAMLFAKVVGITALASFGLKRLKF